MMRGVSTWAVATRGKDGEIAVESHPVVSWVKGRPALRLPVIRGVVALAQSLNIGFKALEVSANAQAEPDEEPIGKGTWAFTIVAALALATGLFFAVPVLLTSLIKEQLGSAWLFWIVEGVVRTTIFLGYIWVLARAKDLLPALPVPRRRAQGHLLLRGGPAADRRERAALRPPAPALRHVVPARRDGRRHLRLRPGRAARVVDPAADPRHRRAAGRRPLLRADQVRRAATAAAAGSRSIIWPGMQLQKLTTREPEDEQVVVAIAALEAVLAVEDPRAASDEDRVGIEVAA